MSSIFTQLVSDNFHRPNEAPLNPSNWSFTNDYDPLQIISNVCVADSPIKEYGGEVLSSPFPSNQFATATIGSFGVFSEFDICVRFDTKGNGYYLGIDSLGGAGIFAEIDDGATFITLLSLAITYTTGDIFQIGCYGSVLTAYKNGVQIGSVEDENKLYASGTPGLFIGYNSVDTDSSITLFTAGLITETPHSIPDDRNYGNFPNNSVNVQGTLTYTVSSVDSRAAGAPVDSRAAGAPVDSRIAPNIPENSRAI